MDRTNARLVRVLQERARLARSIAQLKRELGLRGADPRREREMLERALQRAPAGFSQRELKGLLRAVFAASRTLVERELRHKKAAE